MTRLPGRARVGVIGGGIIGLAAAKTLLERYPGLSLTVLEKEAGVGRHQSSRNSGVVHTGIYYRPGSLKARLCTRGRDMLREYCEEHGIPFRTIGKLLIAARPAEEPRLREIHARGEANGVPQLRLVGAEGINEIEPHAVGRLGLHVPTTAITDFGAVTRALAADVRSGGGRILTGEPVENVSSVGESVLVAAGGRPHRFTLLLVCAGLYADVVAEMAGDAPDPRIVPFRGAYLRLRPSARQLTRGLIYPVPDPRYPFLGIHLTTMVDGRVLVGPSAILAFAREGYSIRDFNPRELWGTVRWKGFRHMVRRHWKTGAAELYRAMSRRAFIRVARRYTPDLSVRDVDEEAMSGVRAQAVDRSGALVDDFRLTRRGPVVNVRNAPSPAATSSLAIAEWLADQVVEAG